MKFIISGNQSAVAELLSTLDPSFIPEFSCTCGAGANTHKLICKFQSKEHEEKYGCKFFVYEIEYDENNEKVLGMKLMHKNSTNIISGCVK